jgi:hypothetical protein
MTFWLVRLLLTCQLLYALAVAHDWRPVVVVFFSVFVLYFPAVYAVEHIKFMSPDLECHGVSLFPTVFSFFQLELISLSWE